MAKWKHWLMPWFRHHISIGPWYSFTHWPSMTAAACCIEPPSSPSSCSNRAIRPHALTASQLDHMDLQPCYRHGIDLMRKRHRQMFFSASAMFIDLLFKCKLNKKSRREKCFLQHRIQCSLKEKLNLYNLTSLLFHTLLLAAFSV